MRAAFVSVPVGEDFGQRDTAPQLRAVLAVHRKQRIFGAHGRTDTDVRCFMAGAGGIGAQAAGALQVDGLGIEQAAQRHQPVEVQQFAGVLRKSGQGCGGSAVRIQQLFMVDLEGRDTGQRSSRLQVSNLCASV